MPPWLLCELWSYVYADRLIADEVRSTVLAISHMATTKFTDYNNWIFSLAINTTCPKPDKPQLLFLS
jgi:hypothetical protein